MCDLTSKSDFKDIVNIVHVSVPSKIRQIAMSQRDKNTKSISIGEKEGKAKKVNNKAESMSIDTLQNTTKVIVDDVSIGLSDVEMESGSGTLTELAPSNV